MEFDPIPVRRPREQVEMQLRAAIIDGSLKSSEKLPSEIALANRFNVSRTTVREALRALSQEGLIRKVPGATGGSFVNRVDHHSLGRQIREGVEAILRLGTISLTEILEVRNMLDVPAAEMAAKTITKEQLSELRSTIDQVKRLELGDPDIEALDARFHSIIAEASGNRMLSAFVRALHESLRPVHYLDFSKADGRETTLQHIAIVRGLTRGDSQEAKIAMKSHLDYLKHVSIKSLSDNAE